MGNDGELDLAFFDVENRVRRLALDKNMVVETVFSDRFSTLGLGQKDLNIERPFRRFGRSRRFFGRIFCLATSIQKK